MLSIMMEDLYPGPNWNYVFGWANYKARTGVFSFGRYDPNFFGMNGRINKEESAHTLLRNACYVMVHEIGHMFGIIHCTYYECLMNGFNSEEE